MKRISLISIAVIVALVASLVGVMFMTDAQLQAQAAEDTNTLYMSEYKGDNGEAEHVDAQAIAKRYDVAISDVYVIGSGQALYEFFRTDSKKVGFLNQSVSLAYNSNRSGYDTIANTISSDAIFKSGRVFDGNGWEINLFGGAGHANSTDKIKDNAGYRAEYRQKSEMYDSDSSVEYEYTGYLVAQNYGTICNFTLNYDSTHTVIDATVGKPGKETGDLGMDTTNRIFSSLEGVFAAGIITGLNGSGGVIDNIKINETKAFTAVKRAGNEGYYRKNGCYAGAIAGRAEDNSLINNCWVDLANGAGVFAGSQGKGGSTVTAGTDDLAVLASAGGLVGNMNAGTAKITYCALTGTGAVKGFGNRASKNGNYKIYAGGVTGGCAKITGNMSIDDAWDDKSTLGLTYGQIQGILSSWTGSRYTNLDNNAVQTVGSLFGVVGVGDNILSVALLYDFETLAKINADEKTTCKIEYFKGDDGKFVLDTARRVKAWSEICPSTEGGYMTAQFIRDNSAYDIRVHIIADGHDDVNDDTLDAVEDLGGRQYSFFMSEGDGGNFIWSANFVSANDTSNHINLVLDNPIYAEIYLISSTNRSKYNYQFGKMGILEYVDTNGEEGKLVKEYIGAEGKLNLPEVRMTNYPEFETDAFDNEEMWNITRSNKSVALSQAYMPGTYRMKVEKDIGEGRIYGYYNEDERRLAWQPSTDYYFTILEGKLNFGVSDTDGWQDSVTFKLQMNAKTDFDTFEFQRNGEFPPNGESAKGFTYYREEARAEYTVNKETLPAGTGKNGTAYIFYAYKWDKVAEENVVVAVSASVTVRVDYEKPEVSEIEYYMIENGVERLMSEEEVDELTYIEDGNENQKWTKNQILARFSVTENGKSGIAIAPNASYIEDEELNVYGDRKVTVTLSDSSLTSLTYVDARGNYTTVELRFNIDRTPGRLMSAGSTYSTTGRFNYSTQSVSVFYKADFGSSGWRLDYTYQKDEDGNDIWQTYTTLSAEDSGAVRTFVINWNMGDVFANKGDILKLKIVNTAGLYNEVEVEIIAKRHEVTKENLGFIIWLRIANIYIDTDFGNIFVDDGSGKSVADILKSPEDRAEYFNKEYDGTDKYESKKDYKFYADLSALKKDSFYFNDKVGVIYTSAGMSKRPKINLGEDGKVPVTLRYDSTEVGDTKLYFQIVLEGNNYFNYAVYFTQLKDIDFEEDVDVEENTYWESRWVDAAITKVKITIELSEQKAFDENAVYYYGDEMPKVIDVYVEQTGEYVPVQIKTDASSAANVGQYYVGGIAPNGYANIEYTINATNITILPRFVAVDLRFDGGEVGNIPTGVQAGRTHKITATYVDVNGETKDVFVEYVLGDKTVTSLGEVGRYTVNLDLRTNNYAIDGQKSFVFNIAKGQLEIEMGLRVKDYTEGAVEYNLIISEESGELKLYKDNELQIKYYKYLDGATYDETDGTIEGKISDDAMTEYPTERGCYHVVVDFVPDNNPNFFAKTYEGDLVIAKAKTQVNVEKVTLQYSFTSEKFTFNLVDAVAEVRSSSNKELWSAGSPVDGLVKVQYKDNGVFKDVAANPNQGGGWYSETGRYEYKIVFNGTADYLGSSIDVVMIVNEAELGGITFDAVEAVYDGTNHLPSVGGLRNYTDLKVVFQYGTNRITADGVNANEKLKNEALSKNFNFVNAREYTVYVTINKTGYATKELTTKVVVKKAKMEGVSAPAIEAEYDGQRHSISFVGLDYDNGTYKYKGEIVTLKNGTNTEGNAYAVNVRIEEGVGPSYYSGEVTLVSSNYEDLVLKTVITIRQALLPYKEIGKTLPDKLPSGLSLSEYTGYYIDKDGNSVECALQYRDRNGNVVELDEEGKLADGRYTVMLVIADTNYYMDRYWNLEVGEINSAELSIYGIAAIAAVGALMAAAVITAIVVVKKRKKAGIV